MYLAVPLSLSRGVSRLGNHVNIRRNTIYSVTNGPNSLRCMRKEWELVREGEREKVSKMWAQREGMRFKNVAHV